MSGTKTSQRAAADSFLLSAGSTPSDSRSFSHWRNAIDGAIKASEQNSAEEREHRYSFAFKGKELKYIVRQELSEDGEWVNVAKASLNGEPMNLHSMNMLNRYFSEASSSQYPRERMIAETISEYYRYSIATRGWTMAGKLIPMLMDNPGRVLSEDGNVLKVHSSGPAVEFSLTKDGTALAVHTNVQFITPGLSIIIEDDSVSFDGNAYWVTHIDHLQKSVLESLLIVKTFPLESYPQLDEMAGRLKGILTVDDTQFRKLEAMPQVHGDGRITVRICPKKYGRSTTYMLEADSEAMEGSTLRFAPGEGPAMFTEGGTLFVRDRVAEAANYSLLDAEISGLGKGASRVSVDCPEDLLHLLEFFHDHPGLYSVEWPEGEKIKFRGHVNRNSWQTFVQTGTLNNWFQLDGALTLAGVKVPAKQLIDAAMNSGDGDFVKIGEDEYVKMTGELKKEIAHLGLIGEEVDGQLCIPKYFAGSLANIISDGDSAFKDLLDKVKQSYELTFDVPQGLQCTLRDYQKTGYEWMCRLASWGAGACLADDMGLGKTVQTIAFLLHEAGRGPSLVIAPTSVVANWRNELERFAPSLNPIVVNNLSDRRTAIAAGKPGDVFIASYGVLGSSAEDLQEGEWNVACLDEAHTIKNRFTKASEGAMSLSAQSRIILTGTPLQNNLSELWNLMQFINPGLLGTFKSFFDKYAKISRGDDPMEKLKALVQPFILRRKKEEVIDEIPTKTAVDYMVQLTEREAEEYESMRIGMADFYQTVPPSQKMKFFFGDLGKLRRAACSMPMVNPSWGEEATKIRELRYLLRGIAFGEDNSIVIFSQYTEFLSDVRKMLSGMNLQYCYMDGETPMAQREHIIEDFQNGVCPIFVCSLKAGGVGINLTRANYVILTDPWWNPAIEQQAMDRAYRIGQTRSVTVIRMIAYRTIEEKVTDLQEAKRSMSDDLLQGTSQTASLTYEDIKEMLSSF